MLVGLGIDIIEIYRIGKAMENPIFMDRIYTRKEQEYLINRKNNPSTAAGYFAAKEAVAKALGTGIGKVKWDEIEVVKDEKGCPGIKLYGSAKKVMEDMKGTRILLSISHSREYAIAQATIC